MTSREKDERICELYGENQRFRKKLIGLQIAKDVVEREKERFEKKAGPLEREVVRLKGLLNESIKGPNARRNWKDERFSALQEE